MCQADTSSFHMGEEDASIELSMPDIPAQVARSVEDKVNQLLNLDLKVKTHVTSPAEASGIPGVKPPEGASVIRVVEIETVEYNACCGTHVSRLGEIGLIKITRTEKMGAGQTRVYFKCGRRALADYQLKHDVTSYPGTAVQGDGKRDRPAHRPAVRPTESRDQRDRAAEEQTARHRGDRDREDGHVATDRPSFEDRHFDELNFLGKNILKHGDFILILSSVPDKRLVFARSDKFADVNCGKIFKEQLQAYNGKGGGSANWANAGFASSRGHEAVRGVPGRVIKIIFLKIVWRPLAVSPISPGHRQGFLREPFLLYLSCLAQAISLSRPPTAARDYRQRAAKRFYSKAVFDEMIFICGHLIIILE